MATELPPLSPSDQETLDALYAELKPQAMTGARDYVMARCPVHLNPYMQPLVDADFPLPPPPAPAEPPVGEPASAPA